MSYATFFGPKLRKIITSDVSNVLDCCLSKYQRELFFFYKSNTELLKIVFGYQEKPLRSVQYILWWPSVKFVSPMIVSKLNTEHLASEILTLS